MLTEELSRLPVSWRVPGIERCWFASNGSLFSCFSTSSSTDSGGGEGEFGKGEEQRLRDYVLQLRAERAAVRATVMELEPLHVDPLTSELCRHPDATRLDLENAVLMQELMAMKVRYWLLTGIYLGVGGACVMDWGLNTVHAETGGEHCSCRNGGWG